MTGPSTSQQPDWREAIALYSEGRDNDLLGYLGRVSMEKRSDRVVAGFLRGCLNHRRGQARLAHQAWLGADLEDYEKVLTRFTPEPKVCLAFARQMLGYRGGDETRRTILLATAPKSGSTFVELILGRLLGLGRTSVSPRTGDQWTFELHDMLEGLKNNDILKTHDQRSVRLHAIVNLFRLRPVVLVRNIFDSLISLHHHSRDDQLPETVTGLSAEDAFWLTVYRAAPRYVDFFASWTAAARTSDSVLILDYETNKQDWVAAIERICAHLRLNVSADAIHAAVVKAEEERLTNPFSARFRSGRSNQTDALSGDVHDFVRRLYRRYPDVDFRSIDPGWSPPS
ncbi:MAG: sulfotransferase domain-containing protein [Alphaproteobacteria bacterium]|nr:sulfotransferase domain-containing protein [Alphaproteobacteria bacterium]